VAKWVVTFGVNIEELREEHGEAIPDLSYTELCDWLEEQLRREFPRYAIVPALEDSRDGETFSIRMLIESPHKPQITTEYFKILEVLPYAVYDSSDEDST
jgi:hypothetical protein